MQDSGASSARLPRILVVDESRIARALLVKQLRGRFDCREEADGERRHLDAVEEFGDAEGHAGLPGQLVDPDEAERQARGEEVITRDNDNLFEREVGPITDEEGYHEEA